MLIKKFLFFVSALFLFQSCTKEDTPAIDDSIPWKLSEYMVSYFDADGQKVFEERPETLKQFDNFIISENTLQFEAKSQSKKANGLQIKGDNSQQTLPVALAFFKGFIQFPGIKIEWGTASEHNNSYFILYISQNGLDFVELAKIKGMGNSDALIHYNYFDKNPKPGINYYKLKQVDSDGTTANFSYTIAVNYIKNKLYHFIMREDKTYLPFPVESFENVEIVRTGDNKEMKWEATEENVRYEENGELKIAAYAKLEMRFTR